MRWWKGYWWRFITDNHGQSDRFGWLWLSPSWGVIKMKYPVFKSARAVLIPAHKPDLSFMHVHQRVLRPGWNEIQVIMANTMERCRPTPGNTPTATHIWDRHTMYGRAVLCVLSPHSPTFVEMYDEPQSPGNPRMPSPLYWLLPEVKHYFTLLIGVCENIYSFRSFITPDFSYSFVYGAGVLSGACQLGEA